MKTHEERLQLLDSVLGVIASRPGDGQFSALLADYARDVDSYDARPDHEHDLPSVNAQIAAERRVIEMAAGLPPGGTGGLKVTVQVETWLEAHGWTPEPAGLDPRTVWSRPPAAMPVSHTIVFGTPDWDRLITRIAREEQESELRLTAGILAVPDRSPSGDALREAVRRELKQGPPRTAGQLAEALELPVPAASGQRRVIACLLQLEDDGQARRVRADVSWQGAKWTAP